MAEQGGKPKVGDPARFGFVERRECPVCASASPPAIYHSPFNEGPVGRFVADYYKLDPRLLAAAPYELARCRQCTLVFQRFVGDDRLLTTLYGEWINDANLPEHDSQYQAAVSAPLLSRDAHELTTAAAYLRMAPDKMRVLDFGMGWALWARTARQLGCDAYGSEMSADRMRFAAENGVKPVRSEELGQVSFDFINTEQVMEHVRDLADIVGQLAASLRPGGILKVSVPSAERALSIVEKLNAGAVSADVLVPVQPLEHVNSFTPRSLAALAHRFGLQIVRPGIVQRYAFVTRAGAVSLRQPKNLLKELVRPVYQYHNRANLYVWMRKSV